MPLQTKKRQESFPPLCRDIFRKSEISKKYSAALTHPFPLQLRPACILLRLIHLLLHRLGVEDLKLGQLIFPDIT